MEHDYGRLSGFWFACMAGFSIVASIVFFGII